MAPDDTGDPDRGRDIFRFFDLPQELRDNIYDNCLEDREMKLRCCLLLTATGVAPCNLFLVSRQFAREYSARVKKFAVLRLHGTIEVDREPFRLPRATRSIAHLEIKTVSLYLPCRARLDDIILQMPPLDDIILQMPELETVAVGFVFPSHFFDRECVRDLLRADKWAEVPKLASLDCFFQSNSFERNPTEGAKLAMNWSKKTGKIKDD